MEPANEDVIVALGDLLVDAGPAGRGARPARTDPGIGAHPPGRRSRPARFHARRRLRRAADGAARPGEDRRRRPSEVRRHPRADGPARPAHERLPPPAHRPPVLNLQRSGSLATRTTVRGRRQRRRRNVCSSWRKARSTRGTVARNSSPAGGGVELLGKLRLDTQVAQRLRQRDERRAAGPPARSASVRPAASSATVERSAALVDRRRGPTATGRRSASSAPSSGPRMTTTRRRGRSVSSRFAGRIQRSAAQLAELGADRPGPERTAFGDRAPLGGDDDDVPRRVPVDGRASAAGVLFGLAADESSAQSVDGVVDRQLATLDHAGQRGSDRPGGDVEQPAELDERGDRHLRRVRAEQQRQHDRARRQRWRRDVAASDRPIVTTLAHHDQKV